MTIGGAASDEPAASVGGAASPASLGPVSPASSPEPASPASMPPSSVGCGPSGVLDHACAWIAVSPSNVRVAVRSAAPSAVVAIDGADTAVPDVKTAIGGSATKPQSRSVAYALPPSELAHEST